MSGHYRRRDRVTAGPPVEMRGGGGGRSIGVRRSVRTVGFFAGAAGVGGVAVAVGLEVPGGGAGGGAEGIKGLGSSPGGSFAPRGFAVHFAAVPNLIDSPRSGLAGRRGSV